MNREEMFKAGILIDENGWLTSPSFARIVGVPDKVYTQPNSGDGGLALHSVVGEEGESDDGIPNRFLSTAKLPNGQYTDDAAASCMFILRKSASTKHIQMYPVTSSTWTSGGREANTTTWPMEAEGGRAPNYGEPLTVWQEQGFLSIARAWQWKKGRKLVDGVTVRPHGQIAREYGYAATSCESNRYRFARVRLAELNTKEDDMTPEEVRKIVREELDARPSVARLNEALMAREMLRAVAAGPIEKAEAVAAWAKEQGYV